MKVLVYSLSGHGFQETCQYEAALEYNALGHEVIFVYCDGFFPICGENFRSCKTACKKCALHFNKRVSRILGNDIRKIPLSSYLTSEMKKVSESYNLAFDSDEDIKDLRFHGVDIGYAALSAYVTWTRELHPVINDLIRDFFVSIMKSEILLTLVVESIVKEEKPDLIIFHNGRYPYYKPLLRISQDKSIPFVCTETNYDINRNVYREFIENDIPHSIRYWTYKMNMYWDRDKDDVNRDAVARLFYENRHNAKYSGDKIYTEHQRIGKLPDKFNGNIENIAIFNSSEDEFGAIGQEVAQYSLFKSQYDGIKAIVEKYKNDNSKHFYLRIHPNLNGLPFDYHVNLYKLDFPNLTIIPGTSDVSSYSLMEACDKVIVFGSTMGAESAFWKKPVICLNFALYYNLGCVYTPKTVEEVWKLIDTINLPILDSESALKFGYCIITSNKEKFRYVDTVGSTFLFRGRKRVFPSIYKFLGSTKLFYIGTLFSSVIEPRLKFYGKYGRIPFSKNLQHLIR